MGGGDWIPLATVMIGLHEAGHAVRCFGDSTIAQICATVSIPFEVVPDTRLYRRILRGGARRGLLDLRHCWPGPRIACLRFVP
jgi:hypothetical protein